MPQTKMIFILTVLELYIFQKKLENVSIDLLLQHIYKIQAYGLVMRGFFFIRLSDFMFKIKILTDFINLFHQIILRNDGIILNCFKNE